MSRSRQSRLLRLAGAMVFAGLSGQAFANPPFSFATTPGQLPKDVVPKHYSIALNPDLNGLTFQGSETIEFEVGQSTDTIILNALELGISSAHIEDMKLPAELILDSQQQTAILHFPRSIEAGAHRLKLDFKGKINQTGEGLFLTRYQSPEGRQKSALCTEMEPTEARRVFPLWDEPAFRATFQLSVQTPEPFMAVSNMPVENEQPLGNGLKQVRFARTPSMSSYLVMFCAGEFEALSDSVDGVQIRVLATQGKKEQGRYALETVKKLIPYYTDYFGLKYPLPKLDLIALPGGIGEAMENWGGITFNDAFLLFDPDHSPQQTRERVFSVIAHEVAHQWFGNLVTMAWWDELWLNEGFATWMQNKATDHFNPSWRVWPREDHAKQDAMDVDARSTTHPIQQAVHDPAEAVSAFDAITYTKAGEIIRMIEHYLGEAGFQAGIRHYMAERQYSNATSTDLWDALERSSSQPIATIASSWIKQPGFPLIRVQSECRNGRGIINLAQERFTIDDPEAKPQQWQVPMSFTRPDGPVKDFLFYGPAARLTDVGCASAVKLNDGDTGYFRVQYASADRAKLLDRFAQFSMEDRLNLLGDTWALVYADRASSADYLDLVERLGEERELAVWEQVIATFDEIDRLQRGEPGRQAFQAHARKLLNPIHRRLGWNSIPGESDLDGLLRALLISALGRLGDEAVIAEARKRFDGFIERESLLAVNLRAPVFGIVGRYADQRTYDLLHDRARKTDSIEQKGLFYGAMSAAQDPKLVDQNLSLALTDELEPRLASELLLMVAHLGEQPQMAWEFLKKHHSALLAKQPFFRRYRFVAEIADSLKESRQAQDLMSFAQANLPAEALPELKKAAERIQFRDRLGRRERTRIDAWVSARQPRDG